jgi:two-component system response regulator AtoC
VLAATNRDLEACVREKLFREDLFYRLNVVRIFVPPLRERRSDIVVLAEHFLRVYSEKNGLPAVGFSDDAILMLQTCSYPGNVRELENMIERAVLMARGRIVIPAHLPARNGNQELAADQFQSQLLTLPLHKSVAELEKYLIQKALRAAAGNKTDAADRLQINRRLLYNKMLEHKIEE